MYIGSSSNSIKRRIKTHFSDLRRGNHHNQPLQRAFNKYGEDSLKAYVLCYALPEQCIEVEQMYLDWFKPEYNTCPVAGSVLGRKLSKEHIEKISSRMKGNKIFLGKKMSEEAKRKISEANKGRKPWIYGKKHSQETKDKISKANKGSKRTEEQKLKISLAGKGRVPYNVGLKMKESSKQKMIQSKSKSTYIAIHIESGEKFVFKNLNQFCREKGLQAPNMKTTLVGFASSGARVTQHKGYRLISAVKDED